MVDALITDQAQKEEAFFSEYNGLLGHLQNREHALNLEYIGMQAHDLNELDGLFTEEEVWATIKELPPD